MKLKKMRQSIFSALYLKGLRSGFLVDKSFNPLITNNVVFVLKRKLSKISIPDYGWHFLQFIKSIGF